DFVDVAIITFQVTPAFVAGTELHDVRRADRGNFTHLLVVLAIDENGTSLIGTISPAVASAGHDDHQVIDRVNLVIGLARQGGFVHQHFHAGTNLIHVPATL